MMNEEKATIYEYVRMCKAFKNDCSICPMSIDNNGTNELCANLVKKYPDKANEIILKWCKEHPVQTMAKQILDIFPNAEVDNGVLDICPKKLDKRIICHGQARPCNECKRTYWLGEV